MFTLPFEEKTASNIPAIRLGRRVPTDAVNMAYFQSVGLSVSENVQIIDLAYTLDEAVLPLYEFDVTVNEEIDVESTLLSVSDRPIEGVDSRYYWYKFYSSFKHLEIVPQTGNTVEEKTGWGPGKIDGTWYEYSGKNIKVLTASGDIYTGEHKIYTRRSNSNAQNVNDVLVYMENREDLYFQYDKGVLLGVGISLIGDVQQEYIEKITPTSVIDEAHNETWFMTHGIGLALPETRVYVVTGQNSITIYNDPAASTAIKYEDREKIYVAMPASADNHSCWFATVKKGRFSIAKAATYYTHSTPSFNTAMMSAIVEVGSPSNLSNVTIETIYDTSYYGGIQPLYKEAIDRAGYIAGKNTIVLPDKVINRNAPVDIILIDGLATYKVSNEITGDLSILSIDNGVVSFYNFVGGQEILLSPGTQVRASYLYREEFIIFTGYEGNDGKFYHLDLNPSLGHWASLRNKSILYRMADGSYTVDGFRISDGYTIHADDEEFPYWMGLILPDSADLENGIFEIPDISEGTPLIFDGMIMQAPTYQMLKNPITIYLRSVRVRASYGTATSTWYDVDPQEDKIQFRNSDVNSQSDDVDIAKVFLVPNTRIGQNIIFDTRQRGGGIKEEVNPIGDEEWFWDIGNFEGRAYSGNQVLIFDIPKHVQHFPYLLNEKGEFKEELIRKKIDKYVAMGTFYLINYV